MSEWKMKELKNSKETSEPVDEPMLVFFSNPSAQV